jgi:toxin ParE1/3/4
MEACCQRLADNPALGRSCDDVRPGLRRMEQGSHVMLYRQDGRDIFISRIFHRTMLPETNAIDDEL